MNEEKKERNELAYTLNSPFGLSRPKLVAFGQEAAVLFALASYLRAVARALEREKGEKTCESQGSWKGSKKNKRKGVIGEFALTYFAADAPCC